MKDDYPIGYKNFKVANNRLQSQSSDEIKKIGEKAVLDLFYRAAEDVPAYKDFLKKKKVNVNKVKSIHDFHNLPQIDKDSYLKKYTAEELSWNGKFNNKAMVISSTSGSTGKPFYFPRSTYQDLQYEVYADLYLNQNFDVKNKSTLYIDAFPLGVWIGGIFTYEVVTNLARKHKYPLSIITTGVNRLEIINSIEKFKEAFDQIIIGSYAPFLVDTLDLAERRGIKLSKLNIGFIFSAEAFNEQFRDYLIKKIKPENNFKFSLNHYGTVDLGTMAYETPLSVNLRRNIFADNKGKEIFLESDRQPTFCQYIPEMYYFENTNEELICSSDGVFPLIKYNLKDRGGIIDYDDPSLDSYIQNFDSESWNLPFVYVYERNDLSVSYYAFLIYPDSIRKAMHEYTDNKRYTYKFNCEVKYSARGHQKLIIRVELKEGEKKDPKRAKNLKYHIHNHFLESISEYRETYSSVGNRIIPQIIEYKYGDERYFKEGRKQKWVN